MPTLKEDLEAALSNLSTAESKLKTSEQAVVDLTTKLSTAESQFKTEQEAHTKAKSDLIAAQGALKTEQEAHTATKTELNALKGDKTTADTRAAEALAAGGITVTKQSPAALNQNQAADAATWERYQKASSIEQAKMRNELGTKLDAAAEAFDREHAAQ